MRVHRFLICMAVVTHFCLLYVWQQTEIFRLAYAGQKRISVFEDLLDRNAVLRYNIARNSSLTRVGNKISNEGELQLPDTYRTVTVRGPKRLAVKLKNKRLPGKETMVSRLFGFGRQAEAGIINP